VRDTRYQWAYLFGAVCPDRGVGAGLVMPCADTEALNRHLEEIGTELNPAENVWEYLRKNKLANRLYETYEDIVEACCDAWNSLMRCRTASHPLPQEPGQRCHNLWRLV
jgi:hypothetical protein